MKKNKIYLAHSVFEQKKGKIIQKTLEDKGYQVHNPFKNNNNRKWDFTNKEVCISLIRNDLDNIILNNYVVCVFPSFPLIKTVGVCCEMFYGWYIKKEVLSVVPYDLKGHPWIIGCSKKVFTSVDDLIKYLNPKS